MDNKVRNRSTLIIGVLISFVLSGCTITKVTIPEPVSLTQRTNFLDGDEMDVVFFDNRGSNEFSIEIQESITNDLKKIYPSATISLLDESEYFNDPSPDKITLKINIAKYTSDIKLMVGNWNARIKFNVTLYDYRGEYGKYTMEIIAENNKLNFLGFNTPEQTTQRSYQDAIYDLTVFLDSSLMK